MKQFIICIMLLIFTTSSFCQQTNSLQTFTREDYLNKSKHQKIAAWVLLGGGSALIITGVLIGSGGEVSFDAAATAAVVGGVGVLSALGSIPLFIASAKNKRKANAATTFFKMETVPVIQQHSFVQHLFPAVSIKINL